MAAVEISLGTLEPLVQKAILDSLDEETRNKLITEAVAFLITPKKETWQTSGAESPVQQMFRQALWAAAQTIVTQIVAESPEYQFKIRQAVDGFLGKLDLETWDTTLMEVVTQALVQHFNKKPS